MFSKTVVLKFSKEELIAKLFKTYDKIQKKLIPKLEEDIVNYKTRNLTVRPHKKIIDCRERDNEFFKKKFAKSIYRLHEREEVSKATVALILD